MTTTTYSHLSMSKTTRTATTSPRHVPPPQTVMLTHQIMTETVVAASVAEAQDRHGYVFLFLFFLFFIYILMYYLKLGWRQTAISTCPTTTKMAITSPRCPTTPKGDTDRNGGGNIRSSGHDLSRAPSTIVSSVGMFFSFEYSCLFYFLTMSVDIKTIVNGNNSVQGTQKRLKQWFIPSFGPY
jgi:uncharacterized membrane-anchored protein YitT (DUF2179 family)